MTTGTPEVAFTGPADINHEENTVEPLLQEIVTVVGGYFDIEPDQLDPAVSFTELGADSMALLGMLRLVEDRYGCKVSLRRLFDDVENPSELAQYIAAHTPAEKLPGPRTVPPATAVTPTTVDVSTAPTPIPPADPTAPAAWRARCRGTGGFPADGGRLDGSAEPDQGATPCHATSARAAVRQ